MTTNRSINMRVLNSIFIFLSVTCSVFARPYEYSYYISLPGQYQSLQVKDGAASVNGGPPFPLATNRGLVANPNFRRGRVEPGLGQNPQFGQTFPRNPEFGRRNDDIPNGELDPLFNQEGRFPQDQGGFYPNTQNGITPNARGFDTRYPNTLNGVPNTRFNQVGSYAPDQVSPDFRQENFNFDRRYNPIQPSVSEFGVTTSSVSPQRFDVQQRAKLSQEIDESKTGDREEVTTQQPCSFCGVDRVNPMDGIDGANADPDSEPVEPTNVGSRANPNILVQNSVVTPASVVVSGYPLTSPVVPYYVLV